MKKTPLIIGRTPRQRAAGTMNILREKCSIHYIFIPPVVTRTMIAWIATELEIAYNSGRIDQIKETMEPLKEAIA